MTALSTSSGGRSRAVGALSLCFGAGCTQMGPSFSAPAEVVAFAVVELDAPGEARLSHLLGRTAAGVALTRSNDAEALVYGFTEPALAGLEARIDDLDSPLRLAQPHEPAIDPSWRAEWRDDAITTVDRALPRVTLPERAIACRHDVEDELDVTWSCDLAPCDPVVRSADVCGVELDLAACGPGSLGISRLQVAIGRDDQVEVDQAQLPAHCQLGAPPWVGSRHYVCAEECELTLLSGVAVEPIVPERLRLEDAEYGRFSQGNLVPSDLDGSYAHASAATDQALFVVSSSVSPAAGGCARDEAMEYVERHQLYRVEDSQPIRLTWQRPIPCTMQLAATPSGRLFGAGARGEQWAVFELDPQSGAELSAHILSISEPVAATFDRSADSVVALAWSEPSQLLRVILESRVRLSDPPMIVVIELDAELVPVGELVLDDSFGRMFRGMVERGDGGWSIATWGAAASVIQSFSGLTPTDTMYLEQNPEPFALAVTADDTLLYPAGTELWQAREMTSTKRASPSTDTNVAYALPMEGPGPDLAYFIGVERSQPTAGVILLYDYALASFAPVRYRVEGASALRGAHRAHDGKTWLLDPWSNQVLRLALPGAGRPRP